MLPTILTAFLVVTESWLIHVAYRGDTWPHDTSRRCHILALYEHARTLQSLTVLSTLIRTFQTNQLGDCMFVCHGHPIDRLPCT
jgi:hypothetical protein